MRKLTSGVSLLAALSLGAAENMVGFQTQNEGFFAVPAKGEVKIDGDASEWDRSGEIQSYRDTSVKDTYSVRTSAMWDETNLYMLFVWRDPSPLGSKINPAFDPSRGWVADAEQLRILAGENAFWTTTWLYDGKVPALGFDAMDAKDLWNPKRFDEFVLYNNDGSPELGKGFASAYKVSEDGRGFVHELRIPWSALRTKGELGKVIRVGMEFLWSDPSGKTFPEHRCVDNMQPGKLSREFYWTAKDAWGDLKLVGESVKTPRRYVPDVPVSKGAIAFSFDVEEPASLLTVAIDDAEGRRVRNLVGGADVELYTESAEGGKRKMVVRWDGLDDDGEAVKPGVYTARPLVLGKPLHGTYERCFYNPGTPPWGTVDGSGAWGADHSFMRVVSKSGDGMVVWCDFAEGGSGTIGIGSDGLKKWGNVRGSSVASANARWAYSVPNDWNTMGELLLRLDAKTGAFAPFVQDGKELPMPLSLEALLGEGALKRAKVVGLSADEDAFALVQGDGTVVVCDAETASVKFRGALPAKPEFSGNFSCVLSGDVLWYFHGNVLCALPLKEGVKVSVPKLEGIGVAGALAIDADGAFYVLDNGPDSQVKMYTADGRLAVTFGKKGGRPSQGHFEKDGIYAGSSVAVDAKGFVWVTENSNRPRRMSVWNPDGSFARDYVGTTGYCASNTFLHDSDPTCAYAEGNEIRFEGKRGWRVAELIQTPDASKIGSAEGDPAPRLDGNGHMFFSSASGKRREYLVSGGDYGCAFVVCMRDEKSGSWKTVAAIADIANVQQGFGGEYNAQIVKPAKGQFADCDPADILAWTDLNGDELIQRSECTIFPALEKTQIGTRCGEGKPGIPCIDGKGWYRRANPADFSIYTSALRHERGTWRIRPASYTKDGAPVYTKDSWSRVPLADEWSLMESTPVPGADKVIAFAHRNVAGKESVWILGFDAKTGRELWKYPSRYHSVHGSHGSPMAQPGLLIGCLRICGFVPGVGGAPSTFMIRGNLGEDYWLTEDGLYVSAFLKDGRIPSPRLPATEEQLAPMPIEGFTGGSEHFCGWAGRQDDGVARMSCGIASQAGMVVRIDGLESVRELKTVAINVDDALLAKAAAERAAREAAEKGPKSLSAKRVKDAAELAAVATITVSRPGQIEAADVRLGWNDESLLVMWDVTDPDSTWKNGTTDATLLFKGGDAVDIQLRPSAEAGDVRDGDVRVLVGPISGQTRALVMREKASGAAAEAKRTYSSPVSTRVFDSVVLDGRVKTSASMTGNGVRVVAEIPWAIVGAKGASGVALKGDVGFLSSDAAGEHTMLRTYFFSKNTGLVSDIPMEAKLMCESWGDIVLE